MIYDCPSCAAALMYNPALGKLECLSCGNVYDVSDFDEKDEPSDLRLKEEAATTAYAYDVENDEMMECNIYTCTACGAELAVNGVETSTFCSYCGQPTIVFSRVSATKKPKYIIPFSVTKEQAISTIREHLSRGSFVPQEIKNFEVERVRGIYIPFWTCDIYYQDEQYLSGQVKSGKSSVTRYFYRHAECDFKNLTLDASKQLNDESSQRLEPYNTHELVPFDSSYLSGFYADCYDMTAEDIRGVALKRTSLMFNEEIKKTIRANSIQILKNAPRFEIREANYTMFPAWFMTFRYQNKPYTILVNGQTRKVIGAVPYEKGKVNALLTIIGVVISFLATFIVWGILNTDSEDSFELATYIGFAGFFLFTSGRSKFKKVQRSIELSAASAMDHFVKDREGGN